MPQPDIIPAPDKDANKAIELLKTYVKEVEVFATQAFSVATAAKEASNNAKICAANAAKNPLNKTTNVEYIKMQATAASKHSKEASEAVQDISRYINNVTTILNNIEKGRLFNDHRVFPKKTEAIAKIKIYYSDMIDYEEHAKNSKISAAKYAEQAKKSLIENDPDVRTYRDLVTESNNLKNDLEGIKNNAEEINTIKKPIDTSSDAKSFLKDYDIKDIILSINVIIGNIIAKNILLENIGDKYNEIENIIAKDIAKDIANNLLIIHYKKEYNTNIKLAEKYLKETIEILYQKINNTLDFVINNYKNMITRLRDENETRNEENITSYKTIIENNKRDLDSIFTSVFLNTTVLKDVKNKTSDKYNEYKILKEELMADVADNAGAGDGGVPDDAASGSATGSAAVHVTGNDGGVDDAASSPGADPGDGGADPGDGGGVDDAASSPGADPGDGGADPGDGGADPDDAAADPDDAAAGSAGAAPGDDGAVPDNDGAVPGNDGETDSKKEALNKNIAIYINQAYDETKFNLPEQIHIDPNTFGDNSISLPLDYCVEYPTIINDDFSKNGKTFTFYRMLINEAGFQKYFINNVIKTSVIHITLTNISENDDTHLLSIRLKDMKNIQTSLLQKLKKSFGISKEDKITLNNMRKAITFFVGMKDGKVNFSNINKFRSVTKSGNSNSFPDPKLKFKNIKYILFLGKLQKKEGEDGDNYITTDDAVQFNISKVIYIYSENIPNTDRFEKVKAETDIFSKKILYCLYNIDYITFTGNYLNYILQELSLKGGNKDEPRPPPPNRFFTAGSGGNNQIDVINNLEVNNNNKDFKEVHEEDVIISDKIIKKKGNKIQKKLTKTKKVPEKAYDIAKEKAPKKAPKKLLIDFS